MPESSPFEWIPPMKGIIGLPTNPDSWVAELKWDGIRAQVLTDGTATVVRSSTGRDISRQFPELEAIGPAVGTSAILDGEIVVFNADRPSFQRVLQRLNVDQPTAALIAENPAVYVAFDLLRLDGNSTIDLPYLSRRQDLGNLLRDGSNWRIPPFVEGGYEQLYALATARELEGIVLKRPDSIYRPGARSHDWRKVKIQLRQEFVVGGWLAGQGALEDEIGSLVVGTWDGANLVMAGLAGSGLTDGERRHLHASFTPVDVMPFVAVPKLERPVTWVAPTTVVEIGFGDWPADGMLRHPVYLGMRQDCDPKLVVRELPAPGSPPDRSAGSVG